MGDIVPVELSRQDISQQYHCNIVFYKGEPIYISNVHDNKDITFRYLITQQKYRAPFNMQDFTPPDVRLGMVNVKETVVFISRIPVRKMNVGVSLENIYIKYPVKDIPCGRAILHGYISSLCIPELGNTIKGVYPSFEEACEIIAKDDASAIAFDRQFCIDGNGSVFYKENIVGFVKRVNNKPTISFNKDKAYLSVLLESFNEKTARISIA